MRGCGRDPAGVAKVISDRVRSVATAVVVSMLAALVLGVVVFGLNRLWPRHDPTPIVTARKDQKAAASAARTIAADVERRNDAASINIDLTTKEIRDAFDALPAPQPPASPSAGVAPRPVPAAPVERVRDRLNEGIARANRAAGAAAAAE